MLIFFQIEFPNNLPHIQAFCVSFPSVSHADLIPFHPIQMQCISLSEIGGGSYGVVSQEMSSNGSRSRIPLDLGIGMFILIYGLFFFRPNSYPVNSITYERGRRVPESAIRAGCGGTGVAEEGDHTVQMGDLCLISRGIDLGFSEAMLCQSLAMFCMFVRAYGII
mgnify:CR=1 FL=1